MKLRFLYIPGCLLAALPAFSQTGGTVNNLGNEDVTIVKDYQPVLNDAFKINILPEGDTTSFSPPVLKYNAEEEPMNAAFNITPIKPVKIKDDNIKKLYHGFLKLGYGNYNTPLAELRFNSLRSKMFDAGVEAKHLSSTGKIKGYGQPDYSQNSVTTYGTRYFDNNSLTGEFGFHRDVFHFYGYKSPPEMFTKSETRHVMNLFEGNVSFKSTFRDKDKLSYSSAIGFNKFSDNRNSDESMINIKGSGGKRYNNSYISSDIGLELLHLDQLLMDKKRTVFRIDPRYTFMHQKFLVEAGANIAYETGDFMKTKLHLYPHAKATLNILSEQVSAFAQVSGNLKTNTLVQYAAENSFLDDFTSMYNTSNKFEFTAGINAKLSREVSAAASGSVGRVIDQPYYVNLNNPAEPVKYGIMYDNAGVIALNVAIEYNQAEKAAFGISMNYKTFNNDSLLKPLFTPAFRIGLHGSYAIAEKIYIKADLNYNDVAYAINYTPGEDTYRKLDAYVDMNLGIDYRYSKVLSAFVQVNNIGMQKYFHYYNYPSYRLNAMAGITYSFW